MNIESCREFIELAQCLNFTEAAGNLNITQPALSKHMLALEKEFGIELLDRGKKGVQLTEGGRILFESAGVIVNEYDKTRNTLEQLKAKRPIHVVGHMEDSDIASLASITRTSFSTATSTTPSRCYRESPSICSSDTPTPVTPNKRD